MSRVVAVIPARGGSVGVPLKNLEPVGGRPLLVRAIESCLATPRIDEVVVSSDHPGILEVAQRAGARTVVRPPELSGPQATSESAVLHAVDQLATEPEVVVLVQCTSPFIDSEALDAAIGAILDGTADTAFSAIDNHAFLWRPDRATGVTGVNHDPAFRARRQDREPEYRETGAFYVMGVQRLRRHHRRFVGRLYAQLVPELHALEVDTPVDLAVARALASAIDRPVAIDVDALVTDFDGVHTDDHVSVDQTGHESVRVSRHDGMGVGLARAAGVKLLILSTEVNPVVAARARKLRVQVLHGLEDKAQALKEWIAAEGLDPTRVAYVGNDINDLGCLQVVGWPIAVADAHPRVLQLARLVLATKGGEGAVREICDLVVAGVQRRDA